MIPTQEKVDKEAKAQDGRMRKERYDKRNKVQEVPGENMGQSTNETRKDNSEAAL